MEKAKILLQLDCDKHPSVFDRVVAIDAGVDQLFSCGAVDPADVQSLVHGLIFTRGPKDLNRSAIFVGGSDVEKGEEIFHAIRQHIIPSFGLQISVLMDANGCNTTAAAAVYVAKKHLPLKNTTALVLGGTGPVGQRVARLLALEGAIVRLASRKKARAESACQRIREKKPHANLEPVGVSSESELSTALEEQSLVIAAGAAGVTLLPKEIRDATKSLRVAIDLNAVPPLGIEGVDVTAKAAEQKGVLCYGAVGVGVTKMKIHRAAIAKLFTANDQMMDAEEVYALAAELD